MNKFEDEHNFVPTGRHDTKNQNCGICNKPWAQHTLDVVELIVKKSSPESRPDPLKSD